MKTFLTMLGAQHPTEESWLVYVKFGGLLLFVFVSGSYGEVSMAYCLCTPESLPRGLRYFVQSKLSSRSEKNTLK